LYIEEDTLPSRKEYFDPNPINDFGEETRTHNSSVDNYDETGGRSVQESNFISSFSKPHVTEVGQFCCACAGAERDTVSHIIQQLYRVVLRRTIAEAHMKLVESRRTSDTFQ